MTGRALPPTSAFAGDDGTADPALAAVLAEHAAGRADLAGVVAELAGARVLVPVLASAEQTGTVQAGGHEHTVDRESSAAVVALQAPDGRAALPVFTSVPAMAAWRADARPVPVEAARAALSAVEEDWQLLVLDPAGPVTVLVPRPAVWALAQGRDWQPAVSGAQASRRVDPQVQTAVRSAVLAAFGTGAGSPVREVGAEPGDRAEVAVVLHLVDGLDRPSVDAVVQAAATALASDEVVTARVDSVQVRLR